ncbi:MAG: proline dehydrogenase family protein [Hyphomicrobiaceae bacterium]
MNELAKITLASAIPTRSDIAEHAYADEARVLGSLINRAMLTADERRRTDDLAKHLVHTARAGRQKHGGIDAFLHEYGLSSEEGIVLMCLAEALLRIPDAETADNLIDDKIPMGDWARHLGNSDSLFVNASTWGLMLTGRVIGLKDARGQSATSLVKRVVARSGEPIIRQAMRQSMRIMGDQFVLGRNIKEALKRARAEEAKGYRYSYDMLGEAARTEEDAERYFKRYAAAVESVGASAGRAKDLGADGIMSRPGLSVKLSAIHPRFEAAKEARVMKELVPRLVALSKAAQAVDHLDRRCRGSRPPRSGARRFGMRRSRTSSSRAGTVSASPSRPTTKQALPAAALAEAARGRAGPAHPVRRQGRLLGQRGEVGAGSAACRITPRCSRAR